MDGNLNRAPARPRTPEGRKEVVKIEQARAVRERALRVAAEAYLNSSANDPAELRRGVYGSALAKEGHDTLQAMVKLGMRKDANPATKNLAKGLTGVDLRRLQKAWEEANYKAIAAFEPLYGKEDVKKEEQKEAQEYTPERLNIRAFPELAKASGTTPEAIAESVREAGFMDAAPLVALALSDAETPERKGAWVRIRRMARTERGLEEIRAIAVEIAKKEEDSHFGPRFSEMEMSEGLPDAGDQVRFALALLTANQTWKSGQAPRDVLAAKGGTPVPGRIKRASFTAYDAMVRAQYESDKDKAPEAVKSDPITVEMYGLIGAMAEVAKDGFLLKEGLEKRVHDEITHETWDIQHSIPETVKEIRERLHMPKHERNKLSKEQAISRLKDQEVLEASDTSAVVEKLFASHLEKSLMDSVPEYRIMNGGGKGNDKEIRTAIRGMGKKVPAIWNAFRRNPPEPTAALGDSSYRIPWSEWQSPKWRSALDRYKNVESYLDTFTAYKHEGGKITSRDSYIREATHESAEYWGNKKEYDDDMNPKYEEYDEVAAPYTTLRRKANREDIRWPWERWFDKLQGVGDGVLGPIQRRALIRYREQKKRILGEWKRKQKELQKKGR